MPLFDHEGVEYGELSDSGPPRLSAAYKFHGGREAVKQAEKKRTEVLREECQEYHVTQKELLRRGTRPS